MKKRNILIAVLLAMAVPMAFSNGSSDTIKIGSAGAYSGDLASYGIPSKNAAELVIEKFNAAGGVDGKLFELIIEDDQCKEEVATNTASKLIGEGVVGVIGHICSGATKAAMGFYADSGIPVISPSATSPELTQSGDYDNFFRSIASDDAQAQLQAEFALNVLGAKRIAIVHDKGDYGKGIAEFANAIIGNSDAEVVLFEGVTPGQTDYTAVISKIASVDPDAIIYGGYHPEASRIVGQMRSRGMDAAFIGGDGIKDGQFIDVAGDASEGVYATSSVDTSTNPLAIQATEEHIAKYGTEPGAFFMNAYAAATALCNAITIAGSTEPDAIKDALRGNYVDTPLGSISFDERGDAIGVGFMMYQVIDGVYVEL